jgi:hypothetical protein
MENSYKETQQTVQNILDYLALACPSLRSRVQIKLWTRMKQFIKTRWYMLWEKDDKNRNIYSHPTESAIFK